MTERINKIIKLAWHDKTSFDEIKKKLDVAEDEVIKIMRTNLKPNSFKLWRKRVNGRRSKHKKKSDILAIFENQKVKQYEVN